MDGLRRAIIAAVTRSVPTERGRAVCIVQPMPGVSWDDAIGYVYPHLANGRRKARAA